MSFSIAGFAGVVELPAELVGSPKNGLRVVRRFKGTREAILSLAAPLVAAGATINTSGGDTAYSVIEAQFPDPQDGTQDKALNVTWELPGNELEKDIYTHPSLGADDATRSPIATLIRRGVQAYQQADSSTLIKAVANYKTLTDAIGTITTTGGLQSAARAITDLLLQGTQTYFVSQFVLRRTTTVSDGYQPKWELGNINKQYSTAALTAAETIPVTLKFALPEGFWLKRTPSITQQQNGRWTIVNEWWHADKISTVLYPVAT